MSIKTVLKVLGAAAVVAGLTPYKVKKDEETGEIKAKALLWNGSYTPATEENEKNISVNVALNIPGKDAHDETHIYTDDVTVSYAGEEAHAEEAAAEEKVEEAVETGEAAEEAVEAVVEAVEAAEEKADEAAKAAEAVEEKTEEAAEAAGAAEEDTHGEG